MSFDWKLYLVLADELINQRTPALEEAYLRSAVSRYYYGIFCIARACIENRGILVPNRQAHKKVRETFQNSSDSTERKIGNDLLRLWEKRKDADYDKNATINLNEALLSSSLAKQILQNLITIKAIQP